MKSICNPYYNYQNANDLIAERHTGLIIERHTTSGSKYYYANFYNAVYFAIDDFDEEYFVDKVDKYKYIGMIKINKYCSDYISYFKV